MEEIRRYSGSAVLVALVGNKADAENLREVEFEEAEAMCQYMPEVLFVLEASAKENSNVEEAFLCLATELKVSINRTAVIKVIKSMLNPLTGKLIKLSSANKDHL